MLHVCCFGAYKTVYVLLVLRPNCEWYMLLCAGTELRMVHVACAETKLSTCGWYEYKTASTTFWRYEYKTMTATCWWYEYKTMNATIQNATLKSKRVPEYNKFQGRWNNWSFHPLPVHSFPEISITAVFLNEVKIPRNYQVPKCLCKQGTIYAIIIEEQKLSST